MTVVDAPGAQAGPPSKKPRKEAAATAAAGGAAAARLAEAADRVRQASPALFASLAEFAGDCTRRRRLFTSEASFSSERAYVKHVECSVFVRALAVNIACTLYDSNCRADKVELEGLAGQSGWEARAGRVLHQEDRGGLAERRTRLVALQGMLIAAREERLAASLREPRLRRLAAKYGFSRGSVDERLLEVLAVLSTAQTDAVRCALVEDDIGRRATQLCRLATASELDVECFADADRDHVKENVVYVADDGDAYVTPGGVPPLRLSRIGARVVLGAALQAEELLKTSGTALETLLHDEGLEVLPQPVPPSFAPKNKAKASASAKAGGGGIILGDDDDDDDKSSSEDGDDGHAPEGLEQSLSALRRSSTKEMSDDDAAAPKTKKRRKKSALNKDEAAAMANGAVAAPSLLLAPTSSSSSSSSSDHPPPTTAGGDLAALPYPTDNELEYLGEVFEGIALHIRLATAKIKGAIKEQSGGAARSGCFFPPPEDGARAGARELKAKLRVHESKVAARCGATARGYSPRLVQLQRKLDLDEWETRVVALLVGRTLSPAIKSLMDSMESTGAVQRLDDTTTVGALLSIFCPESFRDQVEHRRRFYKGARLVKKGVLRLARSRWHSSGSSDLTEQRVELDRRVLDFVVGLDTEINELVEGSELYAPKVNLDDVVLPAPAKKSLLTLCKAFAHLGPYARRTGLFDHALPYGAGLIVLLCGPSGTGKTMTVHGVASRLDKRVLQVDFASLRGKQSSTSDDVDADLRGLFREAEMSDAVLFFDECEALFRSRDSAGGGADRLLRAMLQEIERHAGLVFLATNRPAELDEAMHRRISTVLEFVPPTAQERTRIWATLVGRGKLCCAETIDWDAIGVKYELTGGFIKNALLSALLFALDRDASRPVVQEADIRAGCALQQRGAMHKGHNSNLGEREHVDVNSAANGDAPQQQQDRLAKLALTAEVREKMVRLVSFERQRGVVFGAWGFGDDASASVVLVYGPRGAGKRALCDAVAQKMAASTYKVHARDVLWCDATALTQHPTDVAKRLTSVLDDARLTDSVLVLDGFEYALVATPTDDSGQINLSPQLARALGQLAKFPGVVFLVAHCEEPQSIRLAPDFLRHLTIALPVPKPDSKLRAIIWKALIPQKAPLAKDVDFNKLARHELLPSSIRKAAFTAAAIAAARATPEKGDRVITQADFAVRLPPLSLALSSMCLCQAAAGSEVKRLRGDHADAIDRLFV